MAKTMIAGAILMACLLSGCLTVSYNNKAHIVKPQGTIDSVLNVELDLKPGE